MRKLFLLPVLALFFPLNGQAQFLPNPDFETYTSCPTTSAQTVLAVPWSNFFGSDDYVNCAFAPWGAVASSGTGCMLSFHNAALSGPGFINPEYLSAPLITPLTTGNTYFISWDLNNIQNPACADFGMLFYNSASPPPVGVFGITATPQVLVPLASIPANVYATFTHSFTATAAFDRVVIGPFWAGSCTGFTKIILFDNMKMTSTPLPIDLLSFTGSAHDNYNILEWTTLTEVNNDYFTIESSKDGLTFKQIGTVEGAGNSNVKISYMFADDNPFQKTYYRLKQTDFDGQFKYSETIVISNKHVNQLTVHPNPFEDNFTIQAIESMDYPVLIKVYDYLGRIVYEHKLDNEVTNINVQLNAQLPAGTYILKVSNKMEQVIKKIVRIKQ